MSHGESHAELFANFEEQSQQSDGVRSSGNGHANSLARQPPVVLLEMAEKAPSKFARCKFRKFLCSGRFAEAGFLRHGALAYRNTTADTSERVLPAARAGGPKAFCPYRTKTAMTAAHR